MKTKSSQLGAWCSATHVVVVPENLEHYLRVNLVASKVRSTSRGWKPVGWDYRGSSAPYVPVDRVVE